MTTCLASRAAAAVFLATCAFASVAGQLKVHRYTTTERSFSTNAFWLESERGVVLIDALMLRSDAAALCAAIRTTGKPVVAILLTHPHGDHFGGVPTVRKAFPDVQLIATKATADLIAPTQAKSLRQPWVQAYGDDFENGPIVVDRVVEDGTEVELAGMRFSFSDMGAMEAANNTLIELREAKVLFSGDATVANAVYYVGEGHSRLALQGLEKIKRRYAPDTMVYSGHYEPMRIGPVVDDNLAQVRYLRDSMRDALSDSANLSADGSLTELARGRLSRSVAERWADHADYGFGPVGAAESLNLPRLEMEIRSENAAERNHSDGTMTP